MWILLFVCFFFFFFHFIVGVVARELEWDTNTRKQISLVPHVPRDYDKTNEKKKHTHEMG